MDMLLGKGQVLHPGIHTLGPQGPANYLNPSSILACPQGNRLLKLGGLL